MASKASRNSSKSTEQHAERFDPHPRHSPDAYEQAARAAIIKDLERIESELNRPDHRGSMIGHDHPPEPMESVAITKDDEKQVKDAVTVLKSELTSDKPDVAKVVSTTRVLRDVLVVITKWAGKKADIANDEFIKSYMKVVGGAAAAATVSLGVAGVLGKLGDLANGIASAYSGVVDWLQIVTSVPF